MKHTYTIRNDQKEAVLDLVQAMNSFIKAGVEMSEMVLVSTEDEKLAQILDQVLNPPSPPPIKKGKEMGVHTCKRCGRKYEWKGSGTICPDCKAGAAPYVVIGTGAEVTPGELTEALLARTIPIGTVLNHPAHGMQSVVMNHDHYTLQKCVE